MPVEPLFLSYYSGDAPEVKELAASLRLHGVVPWVDKGGGLMFADETEDEVKIAIAEKCCGLLLYGTANVFDREFVRTVEIPAALERRAGDPGFHLLAVPRGIGFGELSELSKQRFGDDLSRFHSTDMPAHCDVACKCDEVARGMMEKMIARAALGAPCAIIKMQLTSFVPRPDEQDDWLRIDAQSVLSDGKPDPARHDRLLAALISIRDRICQVAGEPRIYLHGNRHLAASFMFGRIFNRFTVDSRQGDGAVWSSDASSGVGEPPFVISEVLVNPAIRALSIEISTGDKSLKAGVDDLIQAGSLATGIRLTMMASDPTLRVSNELCRRMVDQAYSAIARAVADYGIQQIHLFSAVPQSFMLMLGLRFSALPAVQLYEWDGARYHRCCRLPGGRL